MGGSDQREWQRARQGEHKYGSLPLFAEGRAKDLAAHSSAFTRGQHPSAPLRRVGVTASLRPWKTELPQNQPHSLQRPGTLAWKCRQTALC